MTSSKQVDREFIKAAVATLNAANIKDKFLCGHCKRLFVWVESFELPVDKDGHKTDTFCGDCIIQCSCGHVHPPRMDDYHREFCSVGSSQDSTTTEEVVVVKKSKKRAK